MNKWCFTALIFAVVAVSVIYVVETRITRAFNICSRRCFRSCRVRSYASRGVEERTCEKHCIKLAVTCRFCSHPGGGCQKCARDHKLIYNGRCVRAPSPPRRPPTTKVTTRPTTAGHEDTTLEIQPTTILEPTTVPVEPTTVPVEPTTWLGVVTEQWVSGVVGFSSQWSTTYWSAASIIGPPDVYPRYGDLIGAWAPRGINTNDYIQVSFDVAVYATGIDIYETNAAGGTTLVTLFDDRTNASVVVYTNPSPQFLTQSRIFSVPMSTQSFPTRMMRIDVTSVSTGTWSELDAVKLIGYKR